MFLNAVILVLQEILEASLLLSVLLALACLQRASVRPPQGWALLSVVCGILGSWVFAMAVPTVSAWFDYTGQEAMNVAFLLTTIALVLVLGCVWRGEAQAMPRSRAIGTFCLVVIVTFAITREGSEIILYTQGIRNESESMARILLGILVATGISVSCSALLYFALRALPSRHALRVTVLLLALFAGNLAMQTILSFMQADWLPYTMELWNSEAILSESSIAGRLLSALIGYEATPSLAQLTAYAAAFAATACTPLFRHAWRRT
ncbi:MAG: FTR1 family protein [Pseudomonadales bacterium]|jgi:high-affinity iron transporter|nr:FTR1 family protein [Pseudomonadales bacterium]